MYNLTHAIVLRWVWIQSLYFQTLPLPPKHDFMQFCHQSDILILKFYHFNNTLELYTDEMSSNQRKISAKWVVPVFHNFYRFKSPRFSASYTGDPLSCNRRECYQTETREYSVRVLHNRVLLAPQNPGFRIPKLVHF